MYLRVGLKVWLHDRSFTGGPRNKNCPGQMWMEQFPEAIEICAIRTINSNEPRSIHLVGFLVFQPLDGVQVALLLAVAVIPRVLHIRVEFDAQLLRPGHDEDKALLAWAE